MRTRENGLSKAQMPARRFNLAIVTVLCCCGVALAKTDGMAIQSPNRVLELQFGMNDGTPIYQVNRMGRTVIAESRLGFILEGNLSLAQNMKVVSSGKKAIDDAWTQVWGEEREIRNNYTELTVQMVGQDDDRLQLTVVFRVFDDGIGLRYVIPSAPAGKELAITDELTEFAMTGDHRCWWIPAFEYNRYEYHYTDSPLSATNRVHTPITFETKDRLYLSIHEAALTDFASMTLWRKKGTTFEAELVPWSDGIKVRGATPLTSPWRTVQIADTPGGLIDNYLILNLNEPNKLEDTSWIKPGKYVGVWWEMHLNRSSWGSGPNHGATTENTKKYIDFAAKNGFDGVLVEGWNVGWDGDWTANGNVFSFTKAYDDYDLRYLAEYARERGVRLIGHHETAGAVENYERQMEGAYTLCHDLGIRAIKTGYVAHSQNIKRTDENDKQHGEWHHGQYMVRHYRKAVETAAKHQIMLDVHEPIKPTGIRRTYPNMMTREGACGQEYNAWGGDRRNPPDHTTIIPFTRLLAGPMDFTPGIFDLLFEKYRPNDRVSTTLAKQLALYVVLYSPLHMAADLPENYEANPKPFEFIKKVPTDWDKTEVLNAAIGDYVTIARKDHNSSDWYLGSITDENPRVLKVSLCFLEPGVHYVAEIYRDAHDADWKTNPHAVTIESREVNSSTNMSLRLAPGGGLAIRFTPMKQAKDRLTE